MSITIATLPRISPTSLSALLLSAQANKIAVVDVRDSDYIGGHIRSSLHYPSGTLDAHLPELVRKLAAKERVVFHCMLSQQRGPSAALRYARLREEMVGSGRLDVGGGAEGQKGEQNEGGTQGKQEVMVLERGFEGWQEEYGRDERLTEGWRKELWADDD